MKLIHIFFLLLIKSLNTKCSTLVHYKVEHLCLLCAVIKGERVAMCAVQLHNMLSVCVRVFIGVVVVGQHTCQHQQLTKIDLSDPCWKLHRQSAGPLPLRSLFNRMRYYLRQKKKSCWGSLCRLFLGAARDICEIVFCFVLKKKCRLPARAAPSDFKI